MKIQRRQGNPLVLQRWLAAMEWATSERDAGSHYHFLTSAVAPRPIAWVTTVDAAGVVNAAPFSWYQAVSTDPPMLSLCIADRPGGGLKDTLANVLATGELVVNVASRALANELVATSSPFPPGESEVEAIGLRTTASIAVAPPRVHGSPVHMECRLVETHRYGQSVTMVIAEVVHFGADDEVLDQRGNVDPSKVAFLSRLGGRHYAAVEATFEIARPKSGDTVRQ